MPYSDEYITEFLTTEGAALDRYVLLDTGLLGYNNEDGQFMVVIVDENDELANGCYHFLQRRGAPHVTLRTGSSG
jgi:hypothetical protein